MQLNRRKFLKTATPAAALLAGLPEGWMGTAYASDAPETTDVRFGVIALTDNASIVMAHELGYFKKFGINSVISKEASWAVIRDKLTLGENHATHTTAMKDMGVKVNAADMAPLKLTDGVFDPKNAEKYATSFPIHNLQR